jgi:dCMP deaminase
MYNNKKWDLRFLNLAKEVSTWSKDPSYGIGAIIANNKNRLVSLGYNGYPRGIKDKGMENREEKLAKTIHAEVNAILFANRNLEDHSLFVYPLLPCSVCMSIILQVGITRVVAMVSIENNDLIERWEKSNKIGLDIAKELNIPIIIYKEG